MKIKLPDNIEEPVVIEVVVGGTFTFYVLLDGEDDPEAFVGILARKFNKSVDWNHV